MALTTLSARAVAGSPVRSGKLQEVADDRTRRAARHRFIPRPGRPLHLYILAAGRFDPPYVYERSVRYPEGHRNVIFTKRGIRTLPRLPITDRDNVVHAPDTPCATRLLAHFAQIHGARDVRESEAGPAVLGAKLRKPEDRRQELGGDLLVALPQPCAVETADLVLRRHRALLPRRERPRGSGA